MVNGKLLFCSFCRKSHEQVKKLVAGPGVNICDECIHLARRWLGRRPPKPFPGWRSLEDLDLLNTLPAASEAVRATESILREHVNLLRARGVSWERIGDALGVSRQAVWERFS